MIVTSYFKLCPSLLDSLRSTMKSLIVLESDSKDLKTTKQIVSQEITESINGDSEITLEQIKVVSLGFQKHTNQF